MNERTKNKVKAVLVIIGVGALVCLSVKFLFPYVMPFVIAFAVSMILHPWIEKWHRRTKWNKGLLTTIILLLFFCIMGTGIFYIGRQLFSQVQRLVSNLDIYQNRFYHFIYGFCCNIEDIFGIKAEQLNKAIIDNVTVFIDKMQVNLMPELMGGSLEFLKGLGGFIGTLVIIIVSIILLTRDYKELKWKNSKYFYYRDICWVGRRVCRAGGTYFKSQLIIMSIVTVICIAGLMLTGNPYAFLVGLLIGVLDVLPAFGTGSILIPWALWMLIQGEFYPGAVYLSVYAITSVIREFLEPKLIGGRLGYPPITIIISIYAGLKFYGISGFIFGPFSMILIIELVKEIFQRCNIDVIYHEDDSV